MLFFFSYMLRTRRMKTNAFISITSTDSTWLAPVLERASTASSFVYNRSDTPASTALPITVWCEMFCDSKFWQIYNNNILLRS